MLNFIKKIFSEKPEPQEPKNYTLEEVKKLVSSQISSLEEDLQEELAQAGIQYKDSEASVRDALAQLAEAELQNKNIPAKALQYMTGNRDSYHRLVSQFLSDVSLSDNTTLSRTELSHFHTHFSQKLEQFGKSSVRNFQILQQFFANETRDIASNIQALEKSCLGFKTILDKSGITSLEHVSSEIEALEQQLRRKEQYATRKQDLEDMKSKSLAQVDAANKQLEEFMQSSQTLEMKKLRANQKELDEQLRLHKAQITQLFSPLEKALKKYEKIALEHQEEVVEYVYRPEEALLKDSSLHIVSILKQVEKHVESGKIELPDKKKEKALEAISSITQHTLEQMRKKYKELQEHIESCLSEIKSSGVIEEHKAMQERVAYHQEDVEKHERELKRLGEDNSENIEEQTRTVEKKVTKELGVPVTLTLP